MAHIGPTHGADMNDFAQPLSDQNTNLLRAIEDDFAQIVTDLHSEPPSLPSQAVQIASQQRGPCSNCNFIRRRCKTAAAASNRSARPSRAARSSPGRATNSCAASTTPARIRSACRRSCEGRSRTGAQGFRGRCENGPEAIFAGALAPAGPISRCTCFRVMSPK
jgi:hypothetical protein